MNPPTVLIVDDSDAVCLTLSMMLEKDGFRTYVARDSRETLRYTRERQFDVILIDRNLDRDDGLVLAGTLLDATPDLPIVIMSGEVNMRDEMERSPARLRNLPVLHKPFSRQELLDCLRAVMHKAA